MKIKHAVTQKTIPMWGLIIGLTIATTVPSYEATAGQQAVNLGTAGNFVILAKTGVSTTGSTHVVGDVGVSPAAATYITGFALTLPAAGAFSTSALVTGKVCAPDYANPTPANLNTAVLDMQTAYTDAAGRAPDFTELGAGNIGGLTLAPGVYEWGTGVIIPTDVTLSGGPNDIWIFQVGQTLGISSGKHVVLSGGAQAKNIFWQVAGQTTIATTAVFNGIILDQTTIVLNTGATLNGRALAQAAVTLNGNNVQIPQSTVQTNAQPKQRVKMYVIPVFGPQRADVGFNSWANTSVNDIHTGTLLGVSTNLGSYLNTAYFAANMSQSPYTNYTVRFAVHVVASDPSYMFSPNDLSFTEKSSDSLINYGFVYTNPPASYYGYTPQAMGIKWGMNGASDTTYTNLENWTNLVNEFSFIGPQSVCYQYNPSGYTFIQLSNYLNSVTNQITGKWSLNDNTTNPVVSASRTFYRAGNPYRMNFTGLNKIGNQTYALDFVSGWNDTWTIQASSSVSARNTNWSDVFTASGAPDMVWSSTNANCFFRALLQ